MKKFDQEYDDLRSFLKRQEIPTDCKNAEIFNMTLIGLYSKKYKQASMLIQDELITRGRKCTIKASSNKEVDQELSVAVNSICEYLRFKDLLLSGIPYYTQSPRHLQIRKKVKKNVKINGEKMSVKYAKRKRLQFIDFAVADNVAMKIPPTPQDRGKCEVNRLPAVVVLKRGQINLKYKLACQFGTLESLFNASSLIPYPGPVNLSVEISNTEISLREAARKHSVIKSDIIKCKRKSGYETTHCICKRNNKKCLPNCHTRLKCSNGDECDVYGSFKKMFPKWGDKHRSNENDVFFPNTCTVDRWLALVYIIANSRPQLFSGIIDKYFGESSDLMAILGLARKCD